jgi:hypothetical protein
LQDLLATAIIPTTAAATPDPLTTPLTAQTAEVTATHTPDRQTTTQAVLRIVTQDPQTVLPATQAAEAAATHTPDPPVAQVAIQDLPVVQAAAIQEAVVPQEAPTPAAVQEAMLLQAEDKFRIQNP